MPDETSASRAYERARDYARVANFPAASAWALVSIAESLVSVQRALGAMEGRPGTEGGDMPLGPGAKANPGEEIEESPAPQPTPEQTPPPPPASGLFVPKVDANVDEDDDPEVDE